MPVIPVDKFEWDSLWDSMVALWFDPSHPELRKVISDEMQGQILFGLVDRFGVEHFSIDDEAVRLLHNATPVKPQPNLELPVLGAFVAGDILLTTLRLAVHLDGKASLENAIRIVGAREKKAGRPHSRATLMKIWVANKPVSHLAAALAFSIPTFRALARALQSMTKLQKIVIPKKPNKVSKGHMQRWRREYLKQSRVAERALNSHSPKFFGKAERLRYLGERHFSATQKKIGSLLDPAAMWTVAPEFKLPHVRIKFPPLTKDERAVLENRKQSN